MGSKIEKRFEKHVPVRIWRRSLAQSIREGRGSTILLGAQLKENSKIFCTIPYYAQIVFIKPEGVKIQKLIKSETNTWTPYF